MFVMYISTCPTAEAPGQICTYVYTCMHICICIHMYAYMKIYTRMHVSMCNDGGPWIDEYMCVYVYM